MKGAPQSAAQADKASAKMKELKEELERLRASAADRERLSMTVQSLEDRLKERETQVYTYFSCIYNVFLYIFIRTVCTFFQ